VVGASSSSPCLSGRTESLEVVWGFGTRRAGVSAMEIGEEERRNDQSSAQQSQLGGRIAGRNAKDCAMRHGESALMYVQVQ